MKGTKALAHCCRPTKLRVVVPAKVEFVIPAKAGIHFDL